MAGETYLRWLNVYRLKIQAINFQFQLSGAAQGAMVYGLKLLHEDHEDPGSITAIYKCFFSSVRERLSIKKL